MKKEGSILGKRRYYNICNMVLNEERIRVLLKNYRDI